jgi:hypothetical protein
VFTSLHRKKVLFVLDTKSNGASLQPMPTVESTDVSVGFHVLTAARKVIAF